MHIIKSKKLTYAAWSSSLLAAAAAANATLPLGSNEQQHRQCNTYTARPS